MQQANASAGMADLLMGTHEQGPLTGAHVPQVGQHIMLPEGSTDVLAGGIAGVSDRGVKLRKTWHVAEKSKKLT